MLWPFMGKDGVDLHPGDASGGPVPLIHDIKQGQEVEAQEQGDRGSWEERKAEVEAKAPSSPSGDGLETSLSCSTCMSSGMSLLLLWQALLSLRPARSGAWKCK